MRTQTLNTYVKTKLQDYYNKPLRFKTLLDDSKTDSRLAELAQAYFLTKNEQKKADEFGTYTNEMYLVQNYAKSNQKYVYQFNKQVAARKQINTLARKRLQILFEEEGYSKYRAAKELGTNQSNLTEFYSKGIDGKLSAKKVLKTYGLKK